ncbi:MAG: hypothetical protein ACFFDF_00405 [Candidatus Odinarchaeota archaeon]
MKGFKWSGNKAGHKNPNVRKMYVADGTAIEKGEPIIYTQGTGVASIAAPTDFDDPIYGVSSIEKVASDGVTSIDITEASPYDIFKYKCTKVYTLTDGSTTTALDSSLLPNVNSFWKGGAIRIVTCAADSSLVGRVIKISDSTGATGTLTLDETLTSTLAAGDTIQICPGYMAHDYLGYDLDSDSMNPDWEATGGNVLRIYDSNPDTMECRFTFERHANVS